MLRMQPKRTMKEIQIKPFLQFEQGIFAEPCLLAPKLAEPPARRPIQKPIWDAKCPLREHKDGIVHIDDTNNPVKTTSAISVSA